MALKTQVIVNSVTNLSDARYCAGMGVDMMGFNLEQDSPTFISPEDFKEIAGWVSGVQWVGQFEQSSPEEINAAAEKYGLDLVQLNNLYLIDEMREIKLPIIQQLMVNKDTITSEIADLMALYLDNVTYFLICSNDFQTIDQTNEDFLRQLAQSYPILVGFGIRKDSLPRLLQQVQPQGIGLAGGQEIKPGLKDYEALQDILEVLEVED